MIYFMKFQFNFILLRPFLREIFIKGRGLLDHCPKDHGLEIYWLGPWSIQNFLMAITITPHLET